MEPHPRGTPTPREEGTEDLYDRYLDAACRGVIESPEAFCRRHAVDDPELRALIEALHRSVTAGASASSSRMSDGARSDDPRVLDDFELLEVLGEGGMGIVHLARQRSLDRLVALKVIRPEIARSPTAAARFEREAKAIARLRHPNLVSVHSVGMARGVRYIAMELVEGEGLDEILDAAAARGEHLPAATPLAWVAQLADALAYAHRNGVVHRDVKPSNVRITTDGRPLLLDFGVARDLTSAAATLTQSFVGSPAYIAPEQIGRGTEVDGRVDVYSLGVLLYECVTGRTPFESGTVEQMLGDIIARTPPLPRAINRAISKDLETVILKAMEKDPSRRYASADAFAADLRALLEFRPIAARPPSGVHRLRQFARRRPALATGVIVAGLAMTCVIGLLVVQAMAARRDREDRRDHAMAEAARLVDDQSAAVAAFADLEKERTALEVSVFSQYLSDADHQMIERLEDEAARRRDERHRTYHRVLGLLDAAEDLDADRAAVRDLRTRLYMAMYMAALYEHDAAGMSAYAALARQTDPGDRQPPATASGFTLITEPPGADVYSFRLESLSDLPGGTEHRLVPVPAPGDEWPCAPGDWVLEVVRAAPPLEVGDLLLEVGGHPVRDTILASRSSGAVRRLDRLVRIDEHPVRSADDLRRYGVARTDGEARTFVFERDGVRFDVHAHDLTELGVEPCDGRTLAMRGEVDAVAWTGRGRRALTLPPGLDVRVTATPMPVTAAGRLGTTPLDGVRLERGHHVVLVRRSGYEDVVLPLAANEPPVVRLHRTGTTPPGYVYVPPWDEAVEGDVWIMEREVTIAEYFEFLNDPETLARIDASDDVVFVPRFVQGGLYAERDEDGRFRALPEFGDDHPVFGVSWHDAMAYADWMTRRARREGRPHVYALPTEAQWRGAGANGGFYPYGDRFRPRWFSSCFTRPTPGAEPVMSFPIDRSIIGVYDMTGSMCEWLADDWSESSGQKHVKGGSWAHGGPEDRFRISGGTGLLPTFTDGTTGFRLVLTFTEPPS